MSGWLDGPVMSILQKGLTASSMRNQVLSNNVANIDTPNFKRSDVDFQTIFDQALGRKSEILPLKLTSPRHIPGIQEGSQSGIVTDRSTTIRNDGNNVDVDREMAFVAENGLYYNSLTTALSSQLGLLKMVVK
ncbi:flagellar basal-body rod protein FlgB [Desulfosporosinus orientis DSM 765]|uniref:Flagellar basal body rod protein FlgB n=1 Tax=Desulfosporosinus orientis (strain ATCC 19365 / DSM 765 / NCIMB 8382 / VKM B-1628 / Singapore I) TaxID=768706 RepID=G7WHW7_DESOD|nr:flagellar basal body rod protein FlgB [Desulfosporosinus orientis]AET70264.1 flagellar basal-body rod protein FlgB [Desulfosporosinus orientis DSM 765]